MWRSAIRERPDRAEKGGWAATTVDQSSRPMWGQRLPGAGGIPPGLVRLRLGGGAPYFSRVPTAGGAAVVAVVWLDAILQLEYEVRVASALRKILPIAGRRARQPAVPGSSRSPAPRARPGAPSPTRRRCPGP